MTPDSAGAFLSRVRTEIAPWIERSTVPFFHLRRKPSTNEYEILDKDRTGVLIQIGNDHFVLTAAHNVSEMIADDIYLFMAWDDEEKVPIPITGDKIALTDESTLDVAAIKLIGPTATKLLKRHRPITLSDVATDCRETDGLFLIVGFPKAGMHFREQKWNDPHPHEIKTESLKFVCKRIKEGWKNPAFNYSPTLHIVVGMSTQAISATTGQAEQLPGYEGMQGISGCGIWRIADRKARKPLDRIGLEDCKLVAIEHRYDEKNGVVAGTWIDITLKNLEESFPETKPVFRLHNR